MGQSVFQQRFANGNHLLINLLLPGFCIGPGGVLPQRKGSTTPRRALPLGNEVLLQRAFRLGIPIIPRVRFGSKCGNRFLEPTGVVANSQQDIVSVFRLFPDVEGVDFQDK